MEETSNCDSDGDVGKSNASDIWGLWILFCFWYFSGITSDDQLTTSTESDGLPSFVPARSRRDTTVHLLPQSIQAELDRNKHYSSAL
jgi:hypothetical protein